MGQAAYDYNAVRRRKAPQTQRKANLRVAKGGKRRLTPLQAAVHNAMNLVAAALLVGFAISLLPPPDSWRYVRRPAAGSTAACRPLLPAGLLCAAAAVPCGGAPRYDHMLADP